MKKNRMHKMNLNKAKEAHHLYWKLGRTLKEVAEHFQISISAVHGIVHGIYYPEASHDQ